MQQAGRQFVTLLTHELRTRMNAIMGMTELCLETNLDKEQRQMMQVVQQSSKSLFTLVEGMIDISARTLAEDEVKMTDGSRAPTAPPGAIAPP